MNQFVVSRNLHRDPMTNLKNYIQFIEEDFSELFGGGGNICIFDIVDLAAINDRYGREVGDVLIRSTAHVLCLYFDRKRVFRTEGDAFTVIIKGKDKDVVQIMTEAANHFSRLMFDKGYENFALHHVLYTYDEPILSIEDYYMFVMEKDGQLDYTRKFEGNSLVRHILSSVINRLRISLEYYEEVYNFALVDEISGLPNAKAAKEYLSKLPCRVDRRTDKYTVLFIDGDDLRKYNDISYQAGNEMIRKLGTLIKETIREDDHIFRWLSGDEFLVMLEGTDGETGEMLAERIRTKIESANDSFDFPTTVSIGVACYPMDGRDIDTVIYYSEKANKLAKYRGKNRVVCWREVDVSQI